MDRRCYLVVALIMALGISFWIWLGTAGVGHPTARWLWHDVLGVVD